MSNETLIARLDNSVLTDVRMRVGAIVANNQLQFDGPPAQIDSIFTTGWTVCGNDSIVLSGSAFFYRCLSGNFYKIYNKAITPQCQQITLKVTPVLSSCRGSNGPTSTNSTAFALLSQFDDGQVWAADSLFNVSTTSDIVTLPLTTTSLLPTNSITATATEAISTSHIDSDNGVSVSTTLLEVTSVTTSSTSKRKIAGGQTAPDHAADNKVT
jgi:hypothetical protein